MIRDSSMRREAYEHRGKGGNKNHRTLCNLSVEKKGKKDKESVHERKRIVEYASRG